MNKLKFMTSIFMFCLLSISLSSCKKYPEGPTISLRSKTERVSNTWKIENYKVNGNDLTSIVSNYTETFTGDGNYSYTWGIIGGSGTWMFQNNSTEIKITGTNNQKDIILVIQKLLEKEFWYYYMDGNDKKEIHLIQK